jgi:hypothetical protein
MAKKIVKGGSGGRGSGNYRAYFTTRNGRRIYAVDYGYRAWPFGQD